MTDGRTFFWNPLTFYCKNRETPKRGSIEVSLSRFNAAEGRLQVPRAGNPSRLLIV
jgi:hypothetical protein